MPQRRLRFPSTCTTQTPTFEAHSEAYEAPLNGYDYHPEYSVPQRYIVGLTEGHALIDHPEVIGFPIEPYLTGIWPIVEPGISYIAERATNDMLIQSRADPGVMWAACKKRIVKEPYGLICQSE
jgi:hypothetical protein